VKAFLLCLGLSLTALPLPAQDVTFKSNASSASLLELYSSEGCSSCPPAETWMNNLKTAPGLWKDTFPIAFHVDYWDGLGWPDRFAKGIFTQRQRDYAARLNQDSVYTPEFILNGLEWRRGWLSGQSLPALGSEKSGALAVTFKGKESALSAIYTPVASSADRALTLNVALLGFNLTTNVKAGENSGSRLRHDFVVLGFSTFPLTAKSDGTFQNGPTVVKTFTDDVPGAVVAWISKNDGSIVQITGGWLPLANRIPN
jgi:hypothetical protein